MHCCCSLLIQVAAVLALANPHIRFRHNARCKQVGSTVNMFSLPKSLSPVICLQVVLRELPKPKKRRTNGGSGAADGAPAKRTKKQAQGTNNTSETSGSGGGGGSGGGSSALAGKTADAMPSSTAGDPNTITKIANAADAARANGLPADRSKSQNKKRAGKPVRTSSKSGTHTRDDNPAGASLGTEEEAVAATPNTNADGANLSVKEGANASSIMPNSTVNGDELSTGGRATSQECISRVGPPALDHTSLPGVAETAVTLLVA